MSPPFLIFTGEMDPNPQSFPILSYVLTRLPSFRAKPTPYSTSDHTDIEQPPSPVSKHQVVDDMPRLTDPKIIDAMKRAISDVAQTRSVLKAIGDRPDHEAVDAAKARVVNIEANLSKQLEELVLSTRPADVDLPQWRAHLADKETEYRQLAEREKQPFKTIVQLDEMHVAYEKLLKEAEERLEKIYESADNQGESQEDQGEKVQEEVNEEVIRILQEGCGNGLERVDLSARRLRILPEDFGRIRGLLVLNVSSNQIQVIPDSIAGLQNLEELNVSSNLLELLPDSIGLLQKLKILNVSGNKLTALPDSICHCRSLVELDVSFNGLTYLPTNIGLELVNLEKLSIQLNKIRSFPSSVCEMKSLRYLDAHFNELRGLPLAIGKLTNLEVLILSSNFSDLAELPSTIGDLTNLKELDLSNNQIHALPDTFGRLDKLMKLNLDQNPIVVPPLEVVNQGVEAVKVFMAKRWIEILAKEERKSKEEIEQAQAGWLTRSTSWLKGYASGVSEMLSPRSPQNAYLNQQF